MSMIAAVAMEMEPYVKGCLTTGGSPEHLPCEDRGLFTCGEGPAQGSVSSSSSGRIRISLRKAFSAESK